MRFTARGALSAGCLAATLAACSGHHGAPRQMPLDMQEMRFRQDMRNLASDDSEGRKPGTPGEDKTVSFLTAQFQRMKLKPASGESYVQQVPLVEIRAGEDASLSVSGGRGSLLPLRYGNDMVIWSPRAVPAATLAQSDLVFVGYGIVAPEYHWNDYAGVDVRGKTVLVLVSDPGYGSHTPGVFRGSTMSSYGRWSYKLEEAARQGAAGVLLVYNPGPLGYGWAAVRNTWAGARVDLASSADQSGGPSVEGWLTGEAARGLFAQAGLDVGAVTSAAARPGFKAVPMGLKVSAEVHNTVRRFNSANLVALVPGNGLRHEYVVYTAHWDGLGRDSSGAILDGARADASGVAGLLSIAQSFAHSRPPPERSIALIVFTGGESGLLGSRYYVEHPVVPLDQMAGVIDLDRLHIGGRTRDLTIIGPGNSELEDLARPAALLQGREVHDEPHPEQGLYYATDSINFALHGVPALYVTAGVDDSARGPQYGEAQLNDYMAQRYRQPGDKYSEDWNVTGTLEDIDLYLQVGERLASSHHFPRWYPDSEFSGSHARAAGGN